VNYTIAAANYPFLYKERFRINVVCGYPICSVSILQITICGRAFFGGVQAYVDSDICEDVQILPSSAWTNVNVSCPAVISCRTPVGSGFDRAVVVNSLSSNSPVVKLVSYAAPVITQLLGCNPDSSGNPLHVQGCLRTGGDLLTLIGLSFGPIGAQVFVGSQRCLSDAAHTSPNPHRQVICKLPPGSGLNPVTIVQCNGAISENSSATISYQPCDAGYVQSPLNPLLCVACLPGTVAPSPGALRCEFCVDGTYSLSSASTICIACPAQSMSDPQELPASVLGARLRAS
jgi:hypothetical protein